MAKQGHLPTLCARRCIGQQSVGNPFPPHRATIFQTRGVRECGLFALQRYCISVLLAWRVSCTRLTLASAMPLLCYRQPLAAGGAGVAPSVPVCISIGQQGIFKNSENGEPLVCGQQATLKNLQIGLDHYLTLPVERLHGQEV